MQFRPSSRLLVGLVAALMCGIACKRNGSEQSTSTTSWAAEVQSRRAQIEKVKADNSAGFKAMDTGSLGSATLEMIPYVVFRVLQETEPATFGDDTLNAAGFFSRRDLPSGHNGIIWTEPTQANGAFQLRYMTRSCGSCHVGRVRLADGSMRLIVGGTNTEIGLHTFIGHITSTVPTENSISAKKG